MATTDGTPEGLRERKKRATRELIGRVAHELFFAHGFDRVTVAEIARAAQVSEKTVFNHFPTKEDLVYSGMQEWERALLGSIRDRAPGRSVLGAFRGFITEPRGLLTDDDPATGRRLADIARLITNSPALLARERHNLAACTDSLADLIADEAGADPSDIRPRVAANALIGVHRAVLEHVRSRALAGTPVPTLREEYRTLASSACDLLAQGLDDLAVR